MTLKKAFNRKNWKKSKAKRPPNGEATRTERFARKMRIQPTASESRLLAAMRRVRYVNGWVVSSQVVLGPYIADIYIPNRKVIVEVDGPTHVGREEYDARRDSFLRNSGWRIIHVTNAEVWQELDAVIGKITLFVDTVGKKFKGWK